MAVARTESPGLSRFVLPIAGLIGLGLCVAGILVLYDPQGGPNLLASIYEALGNTSGATDLRNGSGDQVIAKLLLAVIALLVGVGGIWLLFIGVGALVSLLQPKWRDRILPWVFAGPALALLAVFLLYPAAGTILRSFQDNEGQFTLANFAVMVEPEFTQILRNNAIWLIVGTGASVVLGLIFAGLFDRVRREALAKTIVFLPLAISLVGASVIWGFVYAWQPAGQPQIGLLNAIVVGLGGEPIPWLHDQSDQHLLRDRDPGLAPDRFRHGRLLGGDQGRVGRDHRGGPARWRLRAPDLRPGDRADDPRLDRHGRDDHRHRHPQDLRHRLRDDRRTVQ